MIEQTAKVLRVDNDNILIEVQRQTACGSCSAKSGCGKTLLDNVFKTQPMQVELLNTLGAKENDNVIVGLDESGFVRASFFLYIIPLLTMLGFAMIASEIFSNSDTELFVVIAGMLGLFSGSIFSRFSLRLKHVEQKNLFEPILMKVISKPILFNSINGKV